VLFLRLLNSIQFKYILLAPTIPIEQAITAARGSLMNKTRDIEERMERCSMIEQEINEARVSLIKCKNDATNIAKGSAFNSK
jgi:hypothetical protein